MWNKRSSGSACEHYEARLEDAVENAAERGEGLSLSADLAAHVSGCKLCSETLDSVALSKALLRWGLEPTAGPGPGFATRVLAAIRAEEDRRTSRRLVFWLPVEHLAGRMAMAAAMVVFALTVYVYAYVVPQTKVGTTAQIEYYELVPQPQMDPEPQSKDEVLMSILERNHAR
jgi:hypothetical protein